MLYQLSYTHHVRSFLFFRPAEKKCTGSEGVLAHAFYGPRTQGFRGGQSAGSTYFAAIVFAVSESGPGCGTKIASR